MSALEMTTLERKTESLRALKFQLSKFTPEDIGPIAHERVVEAMGQVQRAIDHCRSEIHRLKVHDGGSFSEDGL